MTQYYTMAIKDGAITFTPVADNPPSAQTLINVPYLSQLSATASYAPGDCGAACLAMLINWQGKQIVTVDDVSKATGQPLGYKALSFDAMIHAVAKFGLTLKHTYGFLADDIDIEIQMGKPLIALVNYQSIPPALRREALYNAGHWIVVVGSDLTGITYHDPDWPDAIGGANKRMATPDFIKAFQTVAPGNALASHALVIR
jgi:uncharacterized protein YvpB